MDCLIECRDTIYRKGRYRIRLDIPTTSTLIEREIDRIAAICSWGVDPNKETEGYEGGRAILICKETPVRKGSVELRGLQISGIGHRNLISYNGTDVFDGSLEPPSPTNFIDLLTGTKMSTGYSVDGKFTITRPVYRPLGTYCSEELAPTVKNTDEVGRMAFEKFSVPHVEAYGWYLDDSLRDQNGSFGFIILPIPDVKKERISPEIRGSFLDAAEGKISIEDAFELYFSIALPKILPLMPALRELHEKGRVAHLQTHLSNAYDVSGVPYIVDWTTMRHLGANRKDNIVNRVIDFKRPPEDLVTSFSGLHSDTGKVVVSDFVFASEIAFLDFYLKKNINENPEHLKEILERRHTDLELLTALMELHGIENQCVELVK